MFEKITEAEINERSMANVSTTPGRRTAFGEGNMDAEALKLRFDRLPRFIAGRLNEVLEGMQSGNFADNTYIQTEFFPISLGQFVKSFYTGELDDMMVKSSTATMYFREMADYVHQLYFGQYTGDLAASISIDGDATLKSFYEEFIKLSETVKLPVVGVDYFTPADKEEIVRNVIAALPVYEGEVVQE